MGSQKRHKRRNGNRNNKRNNTSSQQNLSSSSKVVPIPQNHPSGTGASNSNNKDSKKRILRDIIIGVITAVAILIIENIISDIHNRTISPYIMKDQFNELEKDIEKNIKELSEKLDNKISNEFAGFDERIDKYFIANDNKIEDLNERINTIEQALIYKNSAQVLYPISDDIIQATTISTEMEYVLSSPTWNSSDIVFINAKNDDTYTADGLVNEKILVTYKIDNKENYFYGQYNKYNQWDGECIINVYENNNLTLIMDAIYDNGTLLTYKQANKFTTKSGINVWNISNRTCKDNYSTGENWYYFRGENEYTKQFTFDTVVSENILKIDDFESKLKDDGSWLEGYYCGITQDGHFNDDTSNAFIVKFFEDGTIRTLYAGNFKDGDFCDTSGNAWYITKETNTTYMYYKGNFYEGHPTKDRNSNFENYLSMDRITDILKENNFDLRDINLKIEIDWGENTLREQEN